MHRHEASVRSGQHRHAALTPGAFLNAGPGDWGHSRTLAQASDSVMGFPSADGALGNEFDARALYRATSGVEFDRIRSDDSDLASVVELVDVGGGHKGTEEAVVRCVVGPVTVTYLSVCRPLFPYLQTSGGASAASTANGRRRTRFQRHNLGIDRGKGRSSR
jgi:hypothetical protein